MADRTSIDRAAWAALVSALIDSTARGNQAEFSRKINVSSRTITRWLKQENSVNSDNIRDIARALNQSPVDLLVAVGYLRNDETEATQAGGYDPDILALMSKLADPKTSPSVKRWIRQQMRSLVDMPQDEAAGGSEAAG
ncbi:helix-turn-helix transcriptional regulator [Micromonospora sp. NPDC005174]|uniref:helix-turn-helix domain-containing protein n=1 Tax=Micromonospora sp. NPDC005174 TaxID=3157018 RepID=UPI0033BEA79C